MIEKVAPLPKRRDDIPHRSLQPVNVGDFTPASAYRTLLKEARSDRSTRPMGSCSRCHLAINSHSTSSAAAEFLYAPQRHNRLRGRLLHQLQEPTSPNVYYWWAQRSRSHHLPKRRRRQAEIRLAGEIMEAYARSVDEAASTDGMPAAQGVVGKALTCVSGGHPSTCGALSPRASAGSVHTLDDPRYQARNHIFVNELGVRANPTRSVCARHSPDQRARALASADMWEIARPR